MTIERSANTDIAVFALVKENLWSAEPSAQYLPRDLRILRKKAMGGLDADPEMQGYPGYDESNDKKLTALKMGVPIYIPNVSSVSKKSGVGEPSECVVTLENITKDPKSDIYAYQWINRLTTEYVKREVFKDTDPRSVIYGNFFNEAQQYDAEADEIDSDTQGQKSEFEKFIETVHRSRARISNNPYPHDIYPERRKLYKSPTAFDKNIGIEDYMDEEHFGEYLEDVINKRYQLGIEDMTRIWVFVKFFDKSINKKRWIRFFHGFVSSTTVNYSIHDGEFRLDATLNLNGPIKYADLSQMMSHYAVMNILGRRSCTAIVNFNENIEEYDNEEQRQAVNDVMHTIVVKNQNRYLSSYLDDHWQGKSPAELAHFLTEVVNFRSFLGFKYVNEYTKSYTNKFNEIEVPGVHSSLITSSPSIDEMTDEEKREEATQFAESLTSNKKEKQEIIDQYMETEFNNDNQGSGESKIQDTWSSHNAKHNIFPDYDFIYLPNKDVHTTKYSDYCLDERFGDKRYETKLYLESSLGEAGPSETSPWIWKNTKEYLYYDGLDEHIEMLKNAGTLKRLANLWWKGDLGDKTPEYEEDVDLEEEIDSINSYSKEPIRLLWLPKIIIDSTVYNGAATAMYIRGGYQIDDLGQRKSMLSVIKEILPKVGASFYEDAAGNLIITKPHYDDLPKFGNYPGWSPYDDYAYYLKNKRVKEYEEDESQDNQEDEEFSSGDEDPTYRFPDHDERYVIGKDFLVNSSHSIDIKNLYTFAQTTSEMNWIKLEGYLDILMNQGYAGLPAPLQFKYGTRIYDSIPPIVRDPAQRGTNQGYFSQPATIFHKFAESQLKLGNSKAFGGSVDLNWIPLLMSPMRSIILTHTQKKALITSVSVDYSETAEIAGNIQIESMIDYRKIVGDPYLEYQMLNPEFRELLTNIITNTVLEIKGPSLVSVDFDEVGFLDSANTVNEAFPGLPVKASDLINNLVDPQETPYQISDKISDLDGVYPMVALASEYVGSLEYLEDCHTLSDVSGYPHTIVHDNQHVNSFVHERLGEDLYAVWENIKTEMETYRDLLNENIKEGDPKWELINPTLPIMHAYSPVGLSCVYKNIGDNNGYEYIDINGIIDINHPSGHWNGQCVIIGKDRMLGKSMESVFDFFAPIEDSEEIDPVPPTHMYLYRDLGEIGESNPYNPQDGDPPEGEEEELIEWSDIYRTYKDVQNSKEAHKDILSYYIEKQALEIAYLRETEDYIQVKSPSYSLSVNGVYLETAPNETYYNEYGDEVLVAEGPANLPGIRVPSDYGRWAPRGMGGLLKRNKTTGVIVHQTAGHWKGSYVTLMNPEIISSCNYMLGWNNQIGKYDIIQLAPVDDISWHAGRTTWTNFNVNLYTVGIEVVPKSFEDGNTNKPVFEEMHYVMLAILIEWIFKRYGLDLSGGNPQLFSPLGPYTGEKNSESYWKVVVSGSYGLIMSHRNINPVNKRYDPGDNFDWYRLKELLGWPGSW